MHRLRAVASPVLAVLLLLSAGQALAQTATEPRPVKKGYRRAFTINSSPQQATIFIDDRKYGVVGYTPMKVTLTDGDYKIILELRGYKTEERTLRVAKGVQSPFIVMEREIAPGTLQVLAADPSLAGASLAVDGQVQGSAPKDVKLAVGRHLVEISRDGFMPFSQWIEVSEGQLVTLAPVLKPIEKEKPKGSLLVDSDPAGAEVAIDGVKLSDHTPTVVDALAEGVHVIEVSKPPAKPLKDTVFVKAGERTKFSARLEMPPEPKPEPAAAAPAATTGSLRVTADVEATEVWVDGERKGLAPLLVPELAPGAHLVELRAAPRPPVQRAVAIEAGKTALLEVKLPPAPAGAPASAPAPSPSAATAPAPGTTPAPAPAAATASPTPGKTTGVLRVVSPVPEAMVFIDGARAGVSPVEKEVGAGKHFVLVQKDGYTDFEKEVLVEAGGTIDLTAALKSSGMLRVIASKEGARIGVDGKHVGISPAEANLEPGEHVVTVELTGYEEYRTRVMIKGGQKSIVNAELKAADTGPTMEQLLARQRSISTWGARPMALGNFAVEVSAGYPVWLEGRAIVGVSDASILGWDLGLGVRSYLNNWDLFLTGRLRFVQAGPFSVGAFAQAGGGAGTKGRNSAMVQGGLLASLNFANVVTISGRVFADFWSDRLCPGVDSDAKGMSICAQDPATYSPKDRERLAEMTGVDDGRKLATQRDSDVRFYLSLALEAAVSRNFSLFLVFEGAPAQGERALHSDLFNDFLPGKDPIYNGRLGLTFKY